MPSSTEFSPSNGSLIDEFPISITLDIPSPNISRIKHTDLWVCNDDTRVPKGIRDRWEDDLEWDLFNNLSLIGLPQTTSGTLIEVRLCMAGHAPERASAVLLQPTILIRCGNRLKKAIKTAVKNRILGSATRLVDGRIEVKREASDLAARVLAAGLQLRTPNLTTVMGDKIYFHIQHDYWGVSACGMKLLVTRITPEGEQYDSLSTIGGLMFVEGTILGMTTGHGVIQTLSDLFSRESEETTESDDSESEISTDSEEAEPDGTNSGDNPSSQNQEIPDVSNLYWDQARSYCGIRNDRWGTLTTDGRILVQQRNAYRGADIALLKPDSTSLRNKYYSQESRHWVSITGICPDNQLDGGPVFIVIHPSDSVSGDLLQTTSLFAVNGTAFKTKIIRVGEKLPPGSSGAWVVRGSSLLGVVVAVHPHEPYAHMLTAQNMGLHIGHFYNRQNPSRVEVRLPVDEDVRIIAESTGKNAQPGTGSSLMAARFYPTSEAPPRRLFGELNANPQTVPSRTPAKLETKQTYQNELTRVSQGGHGISAKSKMKGDSKGMPTKATRDALVAIMGAEQ